MSLGAPSPRVKPKLGAQARDAVRNPLCGTDWGRLLGGEFAQPYWPSLMAFVEEERSSEPDPVYPPASGVPYLVLGRRPRPPDRVSPPPPRLRGPWPERRVGQHVPGRIFPPAPSRRAGSDPEERPDHGPHQPGDGGTSVTPNRILVSQSETCSRFVFAAIVSRSLGSATPSCSEVRVRGTPNKNPSRLAAPKAAAAKRRPDASTDHRGSTWLAYRTIAITRRPERAHRRSDVHESPSFHQPSPRRLLWRA
jgi:hypothetical protein